MEKAKKSWQEKLRERTEQAVKDRAKERIEEREIEERVIKELVRNGDCKPLRGLGFQILLKYGQTDAQGKWRNKRQRG